MKKSILFCLLAALLCVSVVSAQSNTTAETDMLSLLTVGNYFTWDNTQSEISDALSGIDGLECESGEDDDLGKNINCSVELDDETDYYEFYFTDDEVLYEILASVVLPEGQDYEEIMDAIAKSYKLSDVDEYSTDATDEFIADYEKSIVVADDTTVVILAGTPETDDEYGTVSLLFADRVYMES